MIDTWVRDFEGANRNALSAGWFVSPLEYFWPDGKNLIDKVFRAPSSPHKTFDQLVSPELFKMSMQADFRAKMMVLAFMRQDISKSFGLEIENGLLHLYRLDFLSCMSQWIYVIEGYCRQLFSVHSLQNVKASAWLIPESRYPSLNRLIQALSDGLAKYLDGVMFKGEKDFHIERLNRHLLLHGNAKNKSVFSQKNCLLLMFILDALVVIEMVKNNQFPQVFDEREGEAKKIERRCHIYLNQIAYAFHDDNLLKIALLSEHL